MPKNDFKHTSGILYRVTKVLECFVLPAVLTVLGLAMLGWGLASAVPDEKELIEVRGSLSSYYFQAGGHGNNSYHTDLVFPDGKLYWTGAVTKENAVQIFPEPSPEIRLYIARDPIKTTEGAIKSYGLWVNGQLIRTVETDLRDEYFGKRLWFPLIGIGLIAAAIYAAYDSRKKYFKFAQIRTK